MWMMILVLVFGACAAGSIYLTFAVARFGVLKRLGGGKRRYSLLASFGCIAVVFGVFVLLMSAYNAIIVLLHVILFFLLFGLVFRIIKAFTGKQFRINWQGWAALAVSAVYLSIGYVLCNNVWQTKYELTTEKQLGSLRIALFADSHVGNTFDGEGLNKYIEQMNEQVPDILLIAGDFVDDGTDRENMIKACEALGKAETKYGVWFAYGNHDKSYYGSNKRGFSAEELESEMKRNGVHILKDEYELIDNRFYIVGRKDKRDDQRKELSEIIKDIDTDKYIIVMDHQPADYQKESETAADLVLSGHTHGGQFFPVTYVGEWFGLNDRTYGYEKRNDTEFIVTSGISCWALAFKTGTKSEYVIIDVAQ